jgi:hypothetical protein
VPVERSGHPVTQLGLLSLAADEGRALVGRHPGSIPNSVVPCVLARMAGASSTRIVDLEAGAPCRPPNEEVAVYASLHPFTNLAPQPEALGPGGPPSGHVVLRSGDGSLDLVLALWETQEQASSTRSGRGYVVVDSHEGAAVDEPPTHAMVLWFHGPRSAAQAAADQLAGTRIAPAVRDVPGVSRTWILRADDLGYVSVSLVTSRDVPAAIEQAVMSTDLLPGEDVALLNGPDRVAVLSVQECELAAVAGAR